MVSPNTLKIRETKTKSTFEFVRRPRRYKIRKFKKKIVINRYKNVSQDDLKNKERRTSKSNLTHGAFGKCKL